MESGLIARFCRLLADLEKLISEDRAALSRDDFEFLVRNQTTNSALISGLEGCRDQMGPDADLTVLKDPITGELLADRLAVVQLSQEKNSEDLARRISQNTAERKQVSDGRVRVTKVRRGYGARRPKIAGTQARHSFQGVA